MAIRRQMLHLHILFASLLVLITLPFISAVVEGTNLQSPLRDDPPSYPHPPKNVAIIGAGAAGSSTAHFLNRLAANLNIPHNLTIFERNDYIGGRSTTVNAYDDPSLPVELGASIFVKVNQILVDTVRELGLNQTGLYSSSPSSPSRSWSLFGSRSHATASPDLGIWDGSRFVLIQNTETGWVDYAKLFWRYGLALIRTIRLMKATVGKFLTMYEGPIFPFADLTAAVHSVGLRDVVAVTGAEFMDQNGIGGLFGSEIVQASTRVNYAQNLDQIHGVEAMVCMATDGAMAIEGGNWRIFDGMVKGSGANLLHETAVTTITKLESGGWNVTYRPVLSKDNSERDRTDTFDEVVLAGPRQSSEIAFKGSIPHEPEAIPYVQLHVTLFTSPHRLSPAAFGLAPEQPVPQIVLTTLPADTQNTGPDFQSISLLREVIDTRDSKQRPEFLYKIFTMEPVDSTFLARVLGLGEYASDQAISRNDIGWMYEKLWDSYPYEYPRVTFEDILLDDGLWYTSGIESFISAMETSSLMGKNVARLIVDKWRETKHS